MTDHTYDSIVVGAGSAGLAFAKAAAKLNANILLIERDKLGGTCVNRGCVPKKILWSAGHMMRAACDAQQQGITTALNLDFSELAQKRDAHIASINTSFAETLDQAGVTLKHGDAQLIDAHTVLLNDTYYIAETIILATGGRPADMDIPGNTYLGTSDDVLGWQDLPQDMVIVGGGYIGCEFAAIFNSFGVGVTLVHDGDHLLDGFPAALAQHVQHGLSAAGIDVITGDGLAKVTKIDDRLQYHLQSGGSGQADRVIAAVGRVPNITQLGDFAQRLNAAESGALAVDEHFATNIDGIHAIGDVADRLPLTTVATADGNALAQILYGQGATPIDLGLVATTTFVYPPAAYVGQGKGEPVYSGTLTPLAQNILAPDSQHNAEFYRLYADSAAGALTAAQIVSAGAADMIALAAAMIAAKSPVSAFSQATAVHPSFAEEFFPDLRT